MLIITSSTTIRLDAILGSTQNLQSLLHGSIVDDADITKTGKVGRESQLDTIAESIGRIENVQNLAHSYAWREHSTISAGHHVIT